jgi:ubiquinone/menaquinone biosynthesis C-methylase UbiE
MFDRRGIKNYLLIQGNILKMPIKSEKIDFIYGGGVIEHFKKTQQSINELYRVLKKNGVSFNTVPYLNLSSLTYRQIWGNIPNFPVLKQIAEFIHIRLLGGRHMIFGYEFSFLGSTLIKLHKKAGFSEIYIDRFRTKLVFVFVHNDFFKKKLLWLADNNRLFWPMVKVVGRK